MTHRTHAQWVFIVAGLAILALPGCGTKWFSSGSEIELQDGGRTASNSESAANSDSGMNAYSGPGNHSDLGTNPESASQPNSHSLFSEPPNLSAQNSPGGGSLSGFDPLTPGQTPSEERVGDESAFSRMIASDTTAKQMAELRREEDAAIAAGFKDAFFGYDRASISDEAQEALSIDAEWIRSHPKAQVKVSGHCDERGTQDYNLVLGDKRAKAVKRYLVELGVNPRQLSTISYGKNRPFCAEHEESCHRQNRRGHFLLSEK